MSVKVIGKHEKDSRACRDALALTLNEMMAQDKSIVYVDCDLMGCINTKRLREHYPDRAFEAGIAEGNAAGVSAGLAATGKKVFFHSFGTFSSRRCLCRADGPCSGFRRRRHRRVQRRHPHAAGGCSHVPLHPRNHSAGPRRL